MPEISQQTINELRTAHESLSKLYAVYEAAIDAHDDQRKNLEQAKNCIAARLMKIEDLLNCLLKVPKDFPEIPL